MKLTRHRHPMLLVGLAAILAQAAGPLLSPARAAEIATDGSEDKTLSPYFQVASDDPNTDRLPLKDTRADIDISGVIAHVKITQTYKNEGKNALEAVYVFPMSTRAAVFAMRMKIGERIVDAEIEKKEAARKLYEQAKAQGKSASLLEQKRPNVFQMNVANIMPGDDIKVQLDYVELLVPDDGVYELVYPSVVGPRYSEKTERANPGEKWIANPTLKAGQPAPYTWDLAANIQAGMPIAGLRSPSHKIAAQFTGKDKARIDLNDPTGGNRDFVLRYRLSGNKVQTGLLLYPGKGAAPGASPDGENFFLAMIQPPKRVTKDMRPNREYVFILDVSGSMYGFPLNTAKKVMHKLLAGLGPKDRFNVMMFSGGNTVVFKRSQPATKANIASAIAAIDQRRGGGGTRILQAVQAALAMPRASGMSTSFVVVTDGYVSVERETFDVIRKGLGEANLFAFGIGSSVNRYIIEGMAHVGMGEPFEVLGPDQADAKAAKFLAYIESPVLTDVKVQFSGLNAYDVVPSKVPDVFAQRPILVFGKYRGKAKGSIRVTGVGGHGKFSKVLDVASYTANSTSNASLRYLWARHKIQALSDYHRLTADPALKERITALGLKYNLMTPFTSFVAIDKQIRNKNGKQVAVRQPLPMPQGVSNLAVGGAATGAGYGRLGATATGHAVAMQRRARYAPGKAAADQAAAPAPATTATNGAAPLRDGRYKESKKAEDITRGDADKAADERTVANPQQRAIRGLQRVRVSMARYLASVKASGKVAEISLVIAPTGKVLKVVILKTNLDAAAKKRLIRKLHRLRIARFSGSALHLRTTLRF